MIATNLALRLSGLGATDASAVLGLNPWKTPLQVWAEKRGEAPEIEQTEAMRWGTILEPIVAAEYARATGRTIVRPETVLHHPKHDMLLCSPDALVVGEKRGAEFKTANAFSASEWGAEGTDEVPQQYVIQCMHCMSVTGYRVWDLAALIGGNDFRLYTVRWDDQVGSEIERRLLAWWQRHMVEGVEPAASRGDVEWLSRRYLDHNGLLIEPSGEATLLAGRYKAGRALRDEGEAEMEEARAGLERCIAENDGLQGEGWRITWRKPKDKATTDWPAVAAALCDDPERREAVVAEFTTSKPATRRFTFTEKDAKS